MRGCCSGVAPALLRCCYGIASLLIPCATLVHPLYNRCTSVEHASALYPSYFNNCPVICFAHNASHEELDAYYLDRLGFPGSSSEQRGRHPAQHRSEERRVGKECRSRWSPDD